MRLDGRGDLGIGCGRLLRGLRRLSAWTDDLMLLLCELEQVGWVELMRLTWLLGHLLLVLLLLMCLVSLLLLLELLLEWVDTTRGAYQWMAGLGGRVLLGELRRLLLRHLLLGCLMLLLLKHAIDLRL